MAIPGKVPPLQLPVAPDAQVAPASWGRILENWARLVTRFCNNPIQSGLSIFTVANLPTKAATGAIAYASNGLKEGETTGNGTGVLVYKSANGTWRRASTDTVVGS